MTFFKLDAIHKILSTGGADVVAAEASTEAELPVKVLLERLAFAPIYKRFSFKGRKILTVDLTPLKRPLRFCESKKNIMMISSILLLKRLTSNPTL